MDAGRSWNKVPRWKNASGKRQSEPGGLPVPSRPKGSLLRVSPPAGEELGGSIFPEGKAERSPLRPGCPGASGNKLLLDFQSLRLMKEDSEDSASDLSDSERVPCPPSPRTPPDLRLRAEEIDPVCFDLDLQPGQGHARPEYCYPDFLPPPCNSWDLRDMALLANTEPRPAPAPRAGGLLGKYVDRLVQLEWLQILTVQGERAKAAWGLAGSDSSRRMESSSNLRGPTPPGNLDAADPPKTSRTQAHANPRKKGKADNCGQASVASEKKLRTNGGKQNPRKFK
ncbi:PREDICTED: protein FAM217B [Myotis brandtii]|uniref:protein FAM217B n=1 Tax=Myotis brandtii TaxID=109478 RepID=UPI0003BBDC23|nr:PREDICTED: protein FAM217B [Myotis brandtii]